MNDGSPIPLVILIIAALFFLVYLPTKKKRKEAQKPQAKPVEQPEEPTTNSGLNQMEVLGLKVEVISIDTAPQEFEPTLPMGLRCHKRFSAPDDSDYVLAKLDESLKWKDEEHQWIVIGARLVGERIKPKMGSIAVNLAIVTDDSLRSESTIDFDKAEFAAVGVAHSD